MKSHEAMNMQLLLPLVRKHVVTSLSGAFDLLYIVPGHFHSDKAFVDGIDSYFSCLALLSNRLLSSPSDLSNSKKMQHSLPIYCRLEDNIKNKKFHETISTMFNLTKNSGDGESTKTKYREIFKKICS
jgi:hypothetical protein